MEKKLSIDELKLKYEIVDNESWFNKFKNLPQVVAIVLAILYFAAGIILAVYMPTTGYAVLALLGGWVVGAVISIAVYAILRISFSYKFLHMTYLRKMIKLMEEKENKE